MIVSLGLAALTLRAGLRLRRARRAGRPRSPRDLRRHLRLAKPTLALLVIGFAGGPVSMVALRGREAFATAHAWIALVTLALLLTTGALGRRLEHPRGRPRPVEAHALFALLSTLAAAAALTTGLVLLP
jgi:hypothetical protein